MVFLRTRGNGDHGRQAKRLCRNDGHSFCKVLSGPSKPSLRVTLRVGALEGSRVVWLDNVEEEARTV